MKPATSGTLSGCIVWILVFGILGSCLVPVAFMVGGFTAQSNFAAHTAGLLICPKGTTGQIYSYETTSTDDNGFPVAATGFELHCLDNDGTIVKNDPFLFTFLWEGISVGFVLILTGVLAFLLAAPAGVLIARLFKPKQKNLK